MLRIGVGVWLSREIGGSAVCITVPSTNTMNTLSGITTSATQPFAPADAVLIRFWPAPALSGIGRASFAPPPPGA